ncbi:glycosyltransferase family 2 protein [Anatilimnocola sp. NA78]|uniref:glycosyltransferase family 2 protein n=1 Tax=Anatilimnocola sp. NA78 TaxID=3415683 RepID=UPI003CE47FBC
MTIRLTALLPCKNEERNIAACIAGAQLVADEVLVADSGSSDQTLQIVEQLGNCRVIEREFISYSSFKNWAIPQAKHEWVLIIDADERLTPELAAEIREQLASVPDDVDGFWIYRQNFVMGHAVNYCGWQRDKVFRLIRRDKCRYRDCRVHEEIDVKPERARKLKNRLQHYTYWSYDQFLAKQLHYTKLGALDRWERGRRASFARTLFAPFLRFVQLYLLRGGIRDGWLGLQICFIQAFLVTFLKEARLWEMQYALKQPAEETAPSKKQKRAA